MVAGGREEAFVGGDAKPVHLRVRVWDRAAADAGEGFPEAVADGLAVGVDVGKWPSVPNRVVVAGCDCMLAVCLSSVG